MPPPRLATSDSSTSPHDRAVHVVRPRILVADENQATLDEVALSLGAAFEVVAARDGATALVLARQESWDLVVAERRAAATRRPGAAPAHPR